MGGNQKIKCTVGSCKYNNVENSMCNLDKIEVKPINNCNTKKTDESMCASYDYGEE